MESALPHCTELKFLDPGVAACVANCRKRPREPDKFPSPEEQDKMLEDLISWVREYETGRFMTISKELSGNTAKPPSVRNPRLSVRCEYADTSLPATEAQLACWVLTTKTGFGMPDSRRDFACTFRPAKRCLSYGRW